MKVRYRSIKNEKVAVDYRCVDTNFHKIFLRVKVSHCTLKNCKFLAWTVLKKLDKDELRLPSKVLF